MPTYSVRTQSATLTKSSPLVSPGAGNPTIRLTSYRCYGEDIPTNASGAASALGFHGISLVSSDYTPPKFNSRSRAAAGADYKFDSADAVADISPALCRMGSPVTHNALVFGTRYFPVALDAETLRVGAGSGLFEHVSAYSEDAVIPSRRCRRTTKRGYFPTLGNTIGAYMKTGSGSYSIIAPSFDNDVHWTDLSAWRSGHAQSDVWNINLFGTKLRRRVVIF